MKRPAIIAACVLFLFALALAKGAGMPISHGFDSLDEWVPLEFPKIERHTKYEVRELDGRQVLVAISNASASGLVYEREFDVYEFPKVRWRWRIENVYEKGDAMRKEGDDYPIRVYVMFTYDPESASFGERVKYGIAKKLYGEYPPHSALNYIWSNRFHDSRILTSPYTERSRLVVLESADAKAGQWVEEEVDIIADYREAFGGDPPKMARLAVMNDSDNTGEFSTSYMDYIEVYRLEQVMMRSGMRAAQALR